MFRDIAFFTSMSSHDKNIQKVIDDSFINYLTKRVVDVKNSKEIFLILSMIEMQNKYTRAMELLRSIELAVPMLATVLIMAAGGKSLPFWLFLPLVLAIFWSFDFFIMRPIKIQVIQGYQFRLMCDLTQQEDAVICREDSTDDSKIIVNKDPEKSVYLQEFISNGEKLLEQFRQDLLKGK
jgi:hypothetical protein